MKIYLAGKISGDDGYQEKFARAAQKFAGHEVLNPAELPEGMEKADYMRRLKKTTVTISAKPIG